MRKIAWAIFAIALLFPKPTFAVSVNITSCPNIITDEPFIISASISGASSVTNYLRIDFFKDQTTTYFGETFNGVDWYGGSTHTQYFPITIQKGEWSGDIQGRVGNVNEHDNSAQYKMRLRRYTSGGGYTASEANSSVINVSLVLPTSTPTPAPIQTSTHTPTPTPTVKPSPTIKPTLTSRPTTYISKTPTQAKSKITETVLADSTTSAINKTSKERNGQKKQENKGANINFSKIFISFGLIILITCAILIILKLKKEEV